MSIADPGTMENTLQMPSPDMEALKDAGGSTGKRVRNVAILNGSQPGLSSLTHTLLAERLRIASLLLFAGFASFLVKRLFSLGEVQTTANWLLFWDHVAVTFVMGFIGFRLCTHCEHALRHLRLVELIVFGGAASLFVFLTYERLIESAALGFLEPSLTAWVLLIFVYALFIPNTWQRAAVVIGLMALAPLLVMGTVRMTSPSFLEVVSDNAFFHGFMSSSGLYMTLVAVAAVCGVQTIGTLRREVYEAQQIGQYKLKKLLGSGGMGDVYLAEHLLLKRPCAIKLIRMEKAGDGEALKRFEREVRATAQLTHWNTVEIFDYGRSDNGTFYYVMEYLPGMNLDQLVRMHGPLPPERVIHLLTQTCEALSEAHAHNLVHRDLKPANIFAAHRGGVYDVAKLLDFGLARPLVELSEDDARLTQEGAIAGSPLFMSPEQVSGDRPDERSDVYSLGVVAYFLLTGSVPFESDRAIKILIAHAHEAPIPPSARNPEVPRDLEDVVMRCLEKDPDHRFQTAESLRQALLDCESAGRWSREQAACWWENHGCPKKRALDEQVFGHAEVATVG